MPLEIVGGATTFPWGMGLRKLIVTIALLAATPAVAGDSCVADYENVVIRSATDADSASMLSGQSLKSYEWGDGRDLQVGDHVYQKYGLPRVLFAEEMQLYGQMDTVPFVREAGTTDEPPYVLYVLTDATQCEFQPYMLAND